MAKPPSSTRRRRAAGRATGVSVQRDAAEVVNCLRRLFKAIHEYSKSMQRQVGLSSPQLWALRILDAEPGLSLGGLSLRMYAHPSTVSGIVDRLVERGSIVRAVDGDDRRGVLLSLTPRGRRLARNAPPPVQQGLVRALERLQPEELRQLRSHLESIVRDAEAHRVAAPFFELES